MKKIVVTDHIQALIKHKKSLFNRSDFRIFTATSNEEALDIHRAEKADLIITNLDMGKMGGELFCSLVRKDEELRKVSIMMICAENKDIDRSSQCKANAFITTPIDSSILFDKAHQLLHIPRRGSYRALLSVSVKGKFESKPFLSRSENISASGMLLESDKILDKGDVVSCSFYLPNSMHIMTVSEVARVVKKTSEFDTNHYGIKFSDITPDAVSAIEAFVKEKTLIGT